MTDKPVNELIQEMREGLEGVTHGDWQWDNDSNLIGVSSYTRLLVAGYLSDGTWIAAGSPPDAAHIARCDPDNIRTILDSHDTLVDALNQLAESHAELVSCGDCGTWEVEDEPEMKTARSALKAAKGTGE